MSKQLFSFFEPVDTGESIGSILPVRRRLWIVNLYFGVGTAPTGALAESAAHALQERGWDVEVLTSRASYNVRVGSVHRFRGRVRWLYGMFRDTQSFLGRLLCWSNFYVAVAWQIFARPLPAKVVLLTTPPWMPALFVVRRWFSRQPVELILWNQDTYPEILAAVHLLPANSWLFRVLRALAGWGVRRLDRVLVLDGAMRQRLAAQGARTIHVVPNWEIALPPASELARHSLVEWMRAARRAYRFIIVHIGNFGWGHDLGLPFDYWRRAPGQRLCCFVFVGGGVQWPLLMRNASGVEGVKVVSYLPHAVLQAVLREADFGLASLESSCAGLMSPSKIHTYLALGKPLIYLGPSGGNVAEAIEEFGCGFHVPERDAVAWERLVARLSDASFSLEEYAAGARRAFEMRYREEIGVQRFCSCVE